MYTQLVRPPFLNKGRVRTCPLVAASPLTFSPPHLKGLHIKLLANSSALLIKRGIMYASDRATSKHSAV